MQNAARMRKGDGIADSQEKPQAVGHGVYFFDVALELLALDEFHGVEDAAILERADVVNGNNSGVLEPGQDARFTDQALCESVVLPGQIQDFQRDAAPQ